MDYYDKEGSQITQGSWAKLFRDPKYSIVKRSSKKKDNVTVATVVTSWIGIVFSIEKWKPLFLTASYEIKRSGNSAEERAKELPGSVWTETEGKALEVHRLFESRL